MCYKEPNPEPVFHSNREEVKAVEGMARWDVVDSFLFLAWHLYGISAILLCFGIMWHLIDSDGEVGRHSIIPCCHGH